MQDVKICNDLYIPKNFKYVQINKPTHNDTGNKFMSCLRKASNLLSSLEKSFEKSKKYEDNLMQCRRSHSHLHHAKEQWDSEASDSKEYANPTVEQNKFPRNSVDVTESWSTMSIVCLQYQYEELSKRYDSLLQVYDEKCSLLNCKDITLERLRKRMNKAQLEIANLNKTVILVGDKYLTLKCKKLEQKKWYKEKIETLKVVIYDILEIAERARLKLDEQLTQRMATEHDAAVTLLLAEIKKCNYLFLENLRLKSKIECSEE